MRVTGRRNASAGPYVPADRADVAVTGLNDGAFRFAGAWAFGAQPGAYGNDIRWSATAGDHYEIPFTATRVDLYAARGPDLGIGAVSVDGGPETLVDFHALTRSDNVLAWSSRALAPGPHTLRVRVTGLKNPGSSGFAVPADRADTFS